MMEAGPIPMEPWVDAVLSAALPGLCRRGEGQDLEFKKQLPEQAHDIGKSIAAFASSGNGRILYGIADDGQILGLADGMTPRFETPSINGFLGQLRK
jgi:predicted HTH transcriptional regulator